MPKKKSQRKILRKEVCMDFIMKILKMDPTTSRKVVVQKFSKHFKVSERTGDKYWKQAKEVHNQFLKLKEEAEAEALLEIEMKGFKEGLKQKIDLQLQIQKHIEDIEALIIKSTHKQTKYSFAKAKAVTYEREMTILEKRGLYNELRGWYKELALLGGYYKPVPLGIDASGVNDLSQLFENITVGGKPLQN